MQSDAHARTAATPALIILRWIAPVLALSFGILEADFLGWLALAVIILVGSKLIWWATERAWGKFSYPR
jgi:hypothetical protein